MADSNNAAVRLRDAPSVPPCGANACVDHARRERFGWRAAGARRWVAVVGGTVARWHLPPTWQWKSQMARGGCIRQRLGGGYECHADTCAEYMREYARPSTVCHRVRFPVSLLPCAVTPARRQQQPPQQLLPLSERRGSPTTTR